MTWKFSQPVVCRVRGGREDAWEGWVGVARGARSRGQVALIWGEGALRGQMTSKFSQPVVCPVLVGREDALEGLVRVASGALSRGQVALISGEAGIGKTRLLTEFLDDGRAAGYRTWQGRFFEQDGES